MLARVTSAKPVELDDIPFTRFHLKMTALTFGAHFNDGFGIGVIGVALTVITPQWHLNGFWQGALGASMLLGLFIGSLIAGFVANRIGRRAIFTWIFVIITICTLAQWWANNPETLFVLRLLIGIAIGGDYAVGHTLLSELLPRKRRGELLGSFSVIWTCGYVFAMILCIVLLNYNSSNNWRFMLIGPGIVSLVVLIFRIGTPESPRWLLRHGRVEEANAVLHKYFGDNVVLETESTQEETGKFRELFGKQYRRRTAFNGIFWAAIVMPYFAIYTFLPNILKEMNMSSLSTKAGGNLLEIYLSIFLLIGAFLGIYLTYKLSRRSFVISAFFILAALLFIVAFLPSSMGLVSLAAMAIFTLVMSAVSNLVGVFPAESFPTRLRSGGVGLSTAISRFGSAASTFALPWMLMQFGVYWTMATLAVILALGGIVSVVWAPETKGKLLTDAGRVDDPKSVGKARTVDDGEAVDVPARELISTTV
ncbi:MAG: MFS transporter [Propionibacteriaceae bacterium]|nr:MFS transporter [Propionibacteriaceae bacterium]